MRKYLFNSKTCKGVNPRLHTAYDGVCQADLVVQECI